MGLLDGAWDVPQSVGLETLRKKDSTTRHYMKLDVRSSICAFVWQREFDTAAAALMRAKEPSFPMKCCRTQAHNFLLAKSGICYV